MLKNIIETLQDIFKSRQAYDTLEAHIVAGNPQSSEDVEILERQFYEQRRNNMFTFFHE